VGVQLKGDLVYICIAQSATPSAAALHVEYVERRIKYGILFIFSPFYEYSNLEYVHVPV